jgi:hypothetical protein
VGYSELMPSEEIKPQQQVSSEVPDQTEEVSEAETKWKKLIKTFLRLLLPKNDNFKFSPKKVKKSPRLIFLIISFSILFISSFKTT